MTLAEAIAELSDLCAASQYPPLTDAQLTTILGRCQVVDSAGLAPIAVSYVPTWDMDRAALAAWRMKAGLASGDFSFAEIGGQYSRAQVIANCLLMAREFSRRIAGTTTVGPPSWMVVP